MQRRPLRRLTAAALAVAVGAALFAPTVASATPTAQASPPPECPAPGELDPSLAPTSDSLWADLTTMVGFGPRHTGHPGDLQYLDHLENRMHGMGLENVVRQPVPVLAPSPMTWPGVQTTGLVSYHLSGVLPGMSNKVVLLIVHSDGQNAIEENGTVTLLRAMEYLSQLPKECRQHTYALAYATCHMALCASWEAPGWALHNPDLMNRTVAIVSPEHMGQKVRLSADNFGELIPWSLWSNSAALRTRSQQMIEETGIPSIGVYPFGIGTAFSSSLISVGKPVIGGMADPLPSFANGLFDPSVGVAAIDPEQFHQISTLFIRMATYIDSLSAEEWRK